ncbi:uncharacterized protein LOC113315677 [Papaver somniferum]|uniref:uncharacterized protein LOC113315677 n=1 Tax=Papaver somniferum TaxID=3469 RepID=UPI000E6F6300|nr:uncharacterized protein LOC113315677 [Papaver somniferum]
MLMSDANPFDIDVLNTLVDAQNKYNSKEVQLNTLLKQKERIRWVKEGAANTNFLHTSLKIRQGRNFISELEDGNGNILSDQGKIAEVLVKHYEEKFAFQPILIEDSLLNAIPEVITQEDQDMLDKLPDEEEIRTTIFNMDPDSFPGPDGFPGCFYRACARSLNQVRPIGLSNVSFKIITKIITSRLSTLLVKLISPQQAVYVKGRCIQEQILLASELKFGFSVGWCDWLHTLFKSAKLSVLVNGGPCGFFSVGRGLRKGDPLSPILFIIMEEVLSRNLSEMVSKKAIIPMVTRN